MLVLIHDIDFSDADILRVKFMNFHKVLQNWKMLHGYLNMWRDL